MVAREKRVSCVSFQTELPIFFIIFPTMAGAAQKHFFKVEMTCEGCAKAITNVLNKHKGAGISNFDVNLKEQTVMVESTLKKEAIMEILKKTGKNTTYIEQK